MQYRRDIDGLRALAVLPVIIYHSGIPVMSGGFIGVDIFFVISGFLISSILLQEIGDNRYSLLTFYERRARRILPALLVVILATLVMGAVLMGPEQFSDMAKSVVATLTFVSNIFFWKTQQNYFANTADFLPLLHTWSLSVEEQFYLFFPPLLYWLMRTRLNTFAVGVIGTIAAFVFAVWGVHRYPEASFFLIPMRAWELGIGVILAMHLRASPGERASAVIRNIAGWLGLAMIVTAITFYDLNTPFPGIAAVPPCLGAALIIWAGHGSPVQVSKLFSIKPVVYIGLISYSLYLWHWPIMVAARFLIGQVALPFWIACLTLLLSVLLATLSLHFVEKPFRNKTFLSRGALLGASLAGIVVTIAVAGIVVANQGWPQRLTSKQNAILASNDFRIDRLPDLCPQTGTMGPGCELGSKGAPSQARFLLWGDSHAGAISPAVNIIARNAGQTGVLAWSTGCPPLMGVTVGRRSGAKQCPAFNHGVLAGLTSHPDIKTVVLHARWALYAEANRPEGKDVNYLGFRGHSASSRDENFRLFDEGLTRTVEAIRATGRKVIVIAAVPEQPEDLPFLYYAHDRFGAPLIATPTLSEVEQRNSRVNALLKSMQDKGIITVVWPAPVLCTPNCLQESHGLPAYRDSNHFSHDAAVTDVVQALARTPLKDEIKFSN